MKYTTKAAEKSTVKITFTFDGEEWKAAKTKAYLKNRAKYAVNGFRKGKAPQNVIEKAYGESVFWDDALNGMIADNYPTVIEKCAKKFTVVGEPDFELSEFNNEKIVIVATVPVKPEVKISSYKGIKIKEIAYNVTDDEVQAEIDRLLDRNARKVAV